MPLSEFKPKTETVLFDGGSFDIRAISLPDVAMLIDSHELSINSMVMTVRNRLDIIKANGKTDDEAMSEIVGSMVIEIIRETPILAGNLICLCADEPGEMETAMKLPVTVQIEALTKIAKLTFTDLASVKKLATDVMSIVRGMLPITNERPSLEAGR
jgi:hypothetical protein